MATFATATATVHFRRCEGEIEQVRREAPASVRAGGAEAAVVGFGKGDDVVDVGLAGGSKMPPRIGSVDAAAHGSDDPGLHRLRVRVAGPVVGRTSLLGHDGETVPGLGGRGAAVADDGGGSERKRGEHGRGQAAEAFVSCHGDPDGGGE